jgi:xanthine/CO dehydrogenase XdhC/CoxF family maturation factor
LFDRVFHPARNAKLRLAHQRFAALRELGVTDEQLGRLRAPIGMNLGAVLPDEIALSILAEMVTAKHGILNAGNMVTSGVEVISNQ